MNKILSIALVGIMIAPFSAFSAASQIKKTSDGGYNVTYDYKDRERSNWYVTGRLGMSFLNWTNEYKTNNQRSGEIDILVPEYGEDESFSFKPVFAGGLSVGHTFDYYWRAELEAGYIGNFSQADNSTEFKLSIPYATLNGYYDFDFGMYLGLGAGVALPMTEINAATFVWNGAKKTSVGVMGSAMLGYSIPLDENFTFDLRYRLSAITGSTHKVTWTVAANDYYVSNKIGIIWDNSVTLGLRYGF
ncbi:MAG: outer membrane beta-barrel protein [Proteobacteria bacterium]|nr:outer membrane beta-barrel protein [Candidatus Enterousia scatequi]